MNLFAKTALKMVKRGDPPRTMPACPSLRFRVSTILRVLKNAPDAPTSTALLTPESDRQLQKKKLPKAFQHVSLNFWVD